MIRPVPLGGHRQAVLKLQLLLAVILTLDHQKVLSDVYRQVNQPLLPVLNGQLTLDGVVQNIAEDGTDVHHIHKVQPGPIGHAGQLHPVAGTVQALAGEDGIQHRVARLVLGLVGADLLLHAIQKVQPPLGVPLHAEDGDLVLQVVVLPVDHINALPGLLVLDILISQNILDGVQLPLHVQLTPLDMVSVQHGHPGQVDQGADVVDALKGGAAERGVGIDEGQIAHQKAGRADDHRGPQLPRPENQGGGRVLPPADQPPHQLKYPGIDHEQKDQGERRCPPAALRQAQRMPGVGVQLPLQRGGKLRGEEGAGGQIARAGQGNIAADGDQAEHQPHRPYPTGRCAARLSGTETGTGPPAPPPAPPTAGDRSRAGGACGERPDRRTTRQWR